MKPRTLVSALGLPALAALTFAVAACGGGSGTSTPAPTVPPGALKVLAGPGLKLDRSSYTATAGPVTIAYIQQDTQRHTLVVKDAAGIIQGTKFEVIKKGDTAIETYTLAAGTYTIYCDVPGHGPMKATLVVS